MDWNAAIERNRAALARVLAALVAMAGFAGRPHPEVRAEGEPRRTLPRHLQRAVLRLLRPAEAAARRLVIAAARGLTVPPPSPRPQAAPAGRSAWLRRPGGTGILLPRGVRCPGAPARPPLARLALPIVDPLRRGRTKLAPGRFVPRILLPGAMPPSPHLRRPRSPFDAVDAGRLALRLGALSAALEDLPAAALRFARWRARRHAALARGRRFRAAPLRSGRPPGAPREPSHEVHGLLDDTHGLAFWALERPDTS
jgi:hypothetical protein